jgi:hypothetical protein
MASELDRQRMDGEQPRIEKGMVLLIGPLGTCIGLVTRAYAEEYIAERTDAKGVCEFCFEEIL